ncbi:MAG: hypothetical protein HONDAALG_01895 [Gammaproteobacteria bacterium]|nr:hypothetical protein [Gammaproteobacteria bacterium]
MKAPRTVLPPVALLVAWLLTGCALSPQTVPLQPVLAIDESDIGQGRTVALDAVDHRADQTLGTRGGVYRDSATISTVDDVAAALRRSMADALGAQGFRVLDAGAPADFGMTVGLEALSYRAYGDPVVRTVEIAAKVSNVITRGDQRYAASAGVSDTRNVLRAPAPEDNEAYVNDTLARALEKLLNDPRYLEFVR